MDKNIIKETMLSLEGAALQSAREKYFDYVADARLDRSEPIESDEQAQAEIASDLSEALDDTLHDHTDKLDKLREVDFGPKPIVTEEALVRLSGRYFVIAVSTSKFTCDGRREKQFVPHAYFCASRRWHRFNNQRLLDHRVSPSYFRLVCKGIRKMATYHTQAGGR